MPMINLAYGRCTICASPGERCLKRLKSLPFVECIDPHLVTFAFNLEAASSFCVQLQLAVYTLQLCSCSFACSCSCKLSFCLQLHLCISVLELASSF